MLQSLFVTSPPSPRSFTDVHRINEDVIIRLKWGNTEYHGRLVSVDSYMNFQLSGTEEFIDGKSTGSLGQVLIRCNNVLWISGGEGSKEVEMSG
jgi:small nuclear ribonucleoprotein F